MICSWKFHVCEGFETTPADNAFRIENSRSGAGIEVAGDRPPVGVFICAGQRTGGATASIR